MKKISLFVLFMVACNRAPDLPDPIMDYEGFVRSSAGALCAKIVRCYAGIYRALPEEMQRRISAKECEESALADLDEKLELHTPVMKQMSVACYRDLLDGKCEEFAALSYWNPSCMILREHSERAFSDGS